MAHGGGVGGQESDDESNGSMPDLEPAEVEAEVEAASERPQQAEDEREIGAQLAAGALSLLTSTAGRVEVNLQATEDDSSGGPTEWEQFCSSEKCEQEYDYPKWPEEMQDPDFFRDELYRMRTDPRHNKNLGRAMQGQEFWNEAARYPWAKILLRREQCWTKRKNVWLEQYKQVMDHNNGREEVMELLEDCPMDVKRLVAPVLQYKIVEVLLLSINEEAKETGEPFSELIQHPETLTELRRMRRRLDEGGLKEAKRLQDEYDALIRRAQKVIEEERKQKENARGRIVIDMEGLKVALDFGMKCKKDGLLEYEAGHMEEAIASWRQGDDTLRKFRAPRKNINENAMVVELHSAVLKNLAQAAIRLERWGEALEAANRVLEMSPGDTKAWFRKACASEGLGHFADAEACLEQIEELAVGRGDQERLQHDVKKKRERLHALKERHAADHQRMLQRGLRKGIFSSDRQAVTTDKKSGVAGTLAGKAKSQALSGPGMAEAASADGAAEPSQPSATERKKITRDGAWDLLDDLETAYTDPSFVQRVDKLISDVRFDARSFMQHLGSVALAVQRPILEKWGFENSGQGVKEMRLAVQDHTRDTGCDPELKRKAEKVNRALYGSPELRMYDRVMVGA
mmetsp:Transcript_25996/g.54997  ORF Transcript_25996/g.54997 Transcript_25996/m.54997 type:complete len:629 (-) Transcript_25996:69-1955(-)